MSKYGPSRTALAVRSTLLAGLGVALWLLWTNQLEHIGVRAPWTGITLVGSALSFVAAGLLGRRWRSCLIAAMAALVGVVVWLLGVPPTPSGAESCDPGCIAPVAFAVFASLAATVLAACGVLLGLLAGVARGRIARRDALTGRAVPGATRGSNLR